MYQQGKGGCCGQRQPQRECSRLLTRFSSLSTRTRAGGAPRMTQDGQPLEDRHQAVLEKRKVEMKKKTDDFMILTVHVSYMDPQVKAAYDMLRAAI